MDGGVQGAHCHPSHDPGGSIGRYVTVHFGEPHQDRNQSILGRLVVAYTWAEG